jgi:hypothetical protein
MGRKRSSFRKSEIERTIKAAQSAGWAHPRVVLDKDRGTMTLTNDAEQAAASNEWDAGADQHEPKTGEAS